MEPLTEHCLQAGFFINSGHAKIIELSKEITKGIGSEKDKAIALYYHIRDGIKYNPYGVSIIPSYSQASNIIQREKQEGHCIDKGIVLAACGRAIGIPTRLQFANVRNHIGTSKLEKHLGTNLLVFHGFMEFYLENKWVKCTPAFNKELCDHLGVSTLEFDGETDSIFQEYDGEGGGYMTYEHYYGAFHDFPLDLFEREMRKYYPQLFETNYVMGS